MRTRFAHAIAATLLVILWIATPLLAVAHVALEEHSFCAEHERLEEAGDEHGQPDTGTAGGEASEESTLRAGPGASGSSTTHLDCSFGESFTRSCITGSGAPQIGVLAQAVPELLFASRVPAVLAIDLLRLAPKSSPPRSA